jgi:thiol-disulfide isomerase/thioredoxin
MRACRWLGVVLLPLFVLVVSAGEEQSAPAPKVELKLVKYPELGAIVRGLKGKVVVVDFWGTFCRPCREEFPKLVELHKKYAKDGFDAVSVSVDPLEEGEEDTVKTKVMRDLQTWKATFTNVLLDEKPEVWQDKLRKPEVPIVFVFNRAGKVAKKYTDNVSYAEIEKLVVELLKEK